ncbi:MAG: hypothetical protein ACJAYG_002477 [Oceanicoccus sp.]|jgi:hypothetical protein
MPELIKPNRLADMELVGYLHRWCIKKRSKQGNQYLHHIVSADEPILHDHPWDFRSMILSGGYTELTPAGEFVRIAGDIYDKKATDLHYISHVEPNTWTIVFTGETIRNWGFLIKDKWVDHEDFPDRPIEAIFRNGYQY